MQATIRLLQGQQLATRLMFCRGMLAELRQWHTPGLQGNLSRCTVHHLWDITPRLGMHQQWP